MNPYPNLLAVRNFCGAHNWEVVFCAKLNETLSAIKLEDGVLTIEGALVGRYTFISFDNAAAYFRNKSWFNILSREEYEILGTIHGFLNWEWYDGWPNNHDKLDAIRDWLYLSHGLLAKVDSNQYYHSAIEHSYPLVHLTYKHGFESGLTFFSDAYNNGENEQYLQYLRSNAINKLEENGIKYNPSWIYCASNNPLRLSIETTSLHGAENSNFNFIGFDFRCRENKNLHLFLNTYS